jgi:hypothetical protein
MAEEQPSKAGAKLTYLFSDMRAVATLHWLNYAPAPRPQKYEHMADLALDVAVN